VVDVEEVVVQSLHAPARAGDQRGREGAQEWEVVEVARSKNHGVDFALDAAVCKAHGAGRAGEKFGDGRHLDSSGVLEVLRRGGRADGEEEGPATDAAGLRPSCRRQ
jgi:hypothetical protein